jgi:hypothetical protein
VDQTIVAYLDAIFPDASGSEPAGAVVRDALMALAMASIAERIDEELLRETLDLDMLCMLLGGGVGAALVGRVMMEPLLDSLPK